MIKYLLFLVLFCTIEPAYSQLWPSFEYNGPWITVRDLPENKQCTESWEIRGGVSDSELTINRLSGISDNWLFNGYYHFYGDKEIEASSWWIDRLYWPPQPFDHSGWVSYSSPNSFMYQGCSGNNHCFFEDSEKLTINTPLIVEGFGFCSWNQDLGGQLDINSSYIVTVSYMPAWMRQPCPNTSLWSGRPDLTEYPRITNIIPTYFLNCSEPIRMCNNYVRKTNGPSITGLTQPSGGALLRVKESDKDRCIYIFCDAPTHRLVLFSVTATSSWRLPRNVKIYGKQIPPQVWSTALQPDSILVLINTGHDSAGCFYRPVDVAVSCRGRYYNPERDFVYVVDQGNHRIVKLKYNIEMDSLIWVDSYADDKLKMPTAIAYADYGDTNMANDDIYVTDARLYKVIRLSTEGIFEADYGGWGAGLTTLGYPTGIAISSGDSSFERILITDSHNHRIMQYISQSIGPIIGAKEYVFPLWPWPLISSIDVDSSGNVYVVNSFHNNVTILNSSIDKVLGVFGGLGHEPGQLDYPLDIYIDGKEIQICELFADSSGIQSFEIVSDKSTE